jgi:hypothetical protein
VTGLYFKFAGTPRNAAKEKAPPLVRQPGLLVNSNHLESSIPDGHRLNLYLSLKVPITRNQRHGQED